MNTFPDPAMNQADWTRVKNVLEAARHLSAAEQGNFVESKLGGDSTLVAEVMSLLEAEQTPAAVFNAMDELAAAASGAEVVREVALDPLAADTYLGPYRLVERIGEGGMGDVWLAEQTEPLKRRVALKVVKLGMDTKQVVARFDQERQALALMDHPHIAKVLDGGATPTGRPYFVMELVHGQDIDEYADVGRLTTRARIDLFLQVCQAAQHAHQKSVLHRDLKPSNLLVRIQDGRPHVKVIDFGIAKALGADLTDMSVHTRMDEVIGTPDYMSPEQTDPTTMDVDTRADIYSLGVVLYELLTGTRPYNFRRANSWAALSLLRQTETIRPSAQFTGSSTQETAARSRSTSVGTLRRELVGDLDWIVMKAIEKDRTRRYQSVGELSADLERYLHSEPVSARPPSVVYKARKFVRRNRVGVAAAAVTILAVASGATAASLGWARAAAEAELASSRELAASAIVQMRSDPELGLLLALRAAEIAPTLQAEDALDRALDSRMLRTHRLGGSIVSSALSPDGRRVAVFTREPSVPVSGWRWHDGGFGPASDPSLSVEHRRNCLACRSAAGALRSRSNPGKHSRSRLGRQSHGPSVGPASDTGARWGPDRPNPSLSGWRLGDVPRQDSTSGPPDHGLRGLRR